MEQEFSDVVAETDTRGEVAKNLAGLSGRELIERALELGEECVDDLNPVQERYFNTVAMRVGVKWPAGFFESSVEQLMDKRL